MQTHEDARFQDIELTLVSHFYRGRSVGSEATCHQIPGHNFLMDIGSAPLSSTAISNVFITHGHNDHCGGIGSHHMRRLGWGLEPATYFVQECDYALMDAFMKAQAALSRAKTNIQIVALGEGMEVPVGRGGMVVRPFRSAHRIPCQGYAMWGKRKKLRSDLRDQPKEFIMAAKARGESINEEVSVPEICYPGDTSLNILNSDAGAVVSKARLLLLECTFIDDVVTPKEAVSTGHVHIEDFIGAAREGAFQNEVILLTHFSARYTSEYIRETLSKRLAEEEIGQKVRLLLP